MVSPVKSFAGFGLRIDSAVINSLSQSLSSLGNIRGCFYDVKDYFEINVISTSSCGISTTGRGLGDRRPNHISMVNPAMEQ